MSGERLPAAGLVLAGGGSRRMGRSKLSLAWDGGTLLTRIITVLNHTVKSTWIVGPPDATPWPVLPGVRFISEEHSIGPLGGLQAGLAAMAEPVGLVVAADMPFVGPEAIRRLWRLAAGAEVTVLRAADGAHPLFGVYRRSCLPAIQRAIEQGQHRMTSFWDALPVRVIDVGDNPFWARVLFNVNTPADYRRALRIRAESATGD
ncbi:MAG: molybdenum cofactor guanylyltransferase [Acidobacteria bacterium]|nr:molybdenum cofactor guanylyltransferase [Acidobacteriota bacterium]